MRLFAILNRNLATLCLTLQCPSFPCVLSTSSSSSNVIILTSAHSPEKILRSFQFPSFVSFVSFRENIVASTATTTKRHILSVRLNSTYLSKVPTFPPSSLPASLVDSSFLNDWIFCHNETEPNPRLLATSSATTVTPSRVVTTVEEVTSFLSSQSIGSLCLLESKDKDLNLILRILNPKAISFMCDLPDESFDQADEESRNVSLSPSTICLVHFKSLSRTCSNELSELKQYRGSFYVEWIKVEDSTLTKVSNLLSNSIKATLASEEEEEGKEEKKDKKKGKEKDKEKEDQKEERKVEGEEDEGRGNGRKSSKGQGEEKSTSSTAPTAAPDDPSDDTTHATPVPCIESTSLLASGKGNCSCRSRCQGPFSTAFLLLPSSLDPFQSQCQSSSSSSTFFTPSC